ncbi:MAG: glycosyltransferase [Rickettsiales bacterium]|nr:glycosyltransferase [Rickettsiales bacterium]|tara:strand:- start:1844 stop:2818 length:975 start_codon:yes stop_codon:yes gene_type:complete
MNSLKRESAIKLSVVVPIYNEESLLKTVFERFDSLTEQLAHTLDIKLHDFELIYVNDGSTDSSLELLHEEVVNKQYVSCINLARNFGHQVAITAGINHAKGDAVVVIDGDLQDPPECILDLYAVYAKGVDVVYAKRKHRLGESWFKLITAAIFYKIISFFSQIPIIQNVGDFRLMSRRVVDVFNKMPEQHRFIRGMIPWVGFKQDWIYYKRDKRYAGKTKFSFQKMLRFSIDGITSFSTVPLKIMSLIGISLSFLGAIYAGYALYEKLVFQSAIEGWTSIVILILVMGGVQLICLGVIGEYIARIHDQVKNRPLYVIEGVYGNP